MVDVDAGKQHLRRQLVDHLFGQALAGDDLGFGVQLFFAHHRHHGGAELAAAQHRHVDVFLAQAHQEAGGRVVGCRVHLEPDKTTDQHRQKEADRDITPLEENIKNVADTHVHPLLLGVLAIHGSGGPLGTVRTNQAEVPQAIGGLVVLQ